MTALSHWQPPQFPGVGHRDALWNAILTHAGEAIALGPHLGAMFAVGSTPEADALCTRVRLREERGGAGLELRVVWRRFPFQALFQAAIEAQDLPALPVALRDALVQGMTDVLARAVWPGEQGERRKPDQLRVLASAPLAAMADELPQDTSWFDVEIGGFGGESILIGVGVSRAALLASAATQDILPARVIDDARALITVAATFTLGAASFPARDLARLTAGTVIMLPRSPLDRRLLRVDKTILEFHAKDGEWILAGRRRKTARPDRHLLRNRDVTNETPINDAGAADNEPMENVTAEAGAPDAPAPADGASHPHDPAHPHDPEPGPARKAARAKAAAAHPADELAEEPPVAGPEEEPARKPRAKARSKAAPEATPFSGHMEEDELVREGVRLADLGLTVDFDIGDKDVSLAEIETWQPGAVVALDPPQFAGRVEVTLRVNGRAIATGDLMAIDDRLAVRLSRLLLRP